MEFTFPRFIAPNQGPTGTVPPSPERRPAIELSCQCSPVSASARWSVESCSSWRQEQQPHTCSHCQTQNRVHEIEQIEPDVQWKLSAVYHHQQQNLTILSERNEGRICHSALCIFFSNSNVFLDHRRKKKKKSSWLTTQIVCAWVREGHRFSRGLHWGSPTGKGLPSTTPTYKCCGYHSLKS